MPRKTIKKYGAAILLLLAILGVSFSLTRPGYFFMHDDIQVMRLFEMEQCFLDGQLPCRWAANMGSNFGLPLFNFYAPLPYYLGMVFRLLGLSFTATVKVLFGLSLGLSGIFMYLLSRELFGKLGGIVAAVLYLYAPYHAVDLYVRGAMSELWALVFFPLIFWSIYKYLKEEKREFFALAIFCLAGLFLSHNIMSLIFTPFAFAWAGLCLLLLKKKRLWVKAALIFFWAAGLCSFFLLPSFFEKSLVNITWMTSDYYGFEQHFVSWRQLLLDRSFGYGPSVWGLEDDLSFQLGWPHWLAVLAAFFLLLRGVLKKEILKKRRGLFLVGFFFALWLGSVFMTHAKSLFVWQVLPLISFVQFPWRFLALAIFAGAVLAGWLSEALFASEKKRVLLAGVLILAAVALNLSYFKPSNYLPETDETILTDHWFEQSRGAMLDYLPRSVKEIPKDLAPKDPWVTEGEAAITEFAKRSNFWRFTVEARNQATINIPVYDFPRWQVVVDQQPVDHRANYPLGTIELTVSPGKHTVVGWFKNTSLRSLAEGISLFSLASLILWFVGGRKGLKDSK